MGLLFFVLLSHTYGEAAYFCMSGSSINKGDLVASKNYPSIQEPCKLSRPYFSVSSLPLNPVAIFFYLLFFFPISLLYFLLFLNLVCRCLLHLIQLYVVPNCYFFNFINFFTFLLLSIVSLYQKTFLCVQF